MKILLVTEKCSQNKLELDGGARLVQTLQRAFGESLSIMHFGSEAHESATWHFDYPSVIPNRFQRRLAHADFIAERVQAAQDSFTHILFVHICMQFGLLHRSLKENVQIWTFPMFLTPSYLLSGELVSEKYFEIEKLTLASCKNILTPSHLEKRQLVEIYSIPKERIHVVPRGVNTALLEPTIRFFNEPLKLCSIGSIKPQKNTLGLLRLFAKVRNRFPEATLDIIGAVQNAEYFRNVQREIQQLKISQAVKFTGYISPEKLPEAICKAHLHLSASLCETFGRSLFETLGSGLPNIAKKSGNAAAEFLQDLPYIRFVDEDHEVIHAIEEMLPNLSILSFMALEIGSLYDDTLLSGLLVSRICQGPLMAISDFDGTLYHKNDPEKTLRCIEAFKKFPTRVVCSARPIPDLLKQLKSYNLEVDWIIGCSGAAVANGYGDLLWISPLELKDVLKLQSLMPAAQSIEMRGEILQMAIPAEQLTDLLGLRAETYQGIAFIAHWQASKLRAVHKLLRHINGLGRVCVFGDGPHDAELLTYFDGTLITPLPENSFQKKEVEYV